MPPAEEDDGGATAAAAASSPSFPWRLAEGPGERWRGHRDAVLTLDVLSEAGGQAQWLASGSEDSTLRLWDVGAGRTAKCYHGFFEGEAVAAVAFGDAGRLFAATSTDVYELDLRAPGVVLRETRAKLAGLSTDDINQLSVQRHPRTGEPKYLAVADDSGQVTLLDASTTPPRPFRTLARRNAGEESGMCTCVAFRPRAPWDLVCGFLQPCTLGLWDFARARCRALDVGAAVAAAAAAAADEKEEEEEDDDDPTTAPPASSQFFNPPYIHGLAFDATGRHVAAALGNGEVAVYEYARANQQSDNGEPPLARLSGGHASSVAGVCFLDDARERDGGQGGGWLRLASAGNDRVVNLWECPAAPRTATATSRGSNDSDRPKPRVVQRIEGLPGKPNWVTSAEAEGGGVRLFVANTTPEIAVYSLRLRHSDEGDGAEGKDGRVVAGGGS